MFKKKNTLRSRILTSVRGKKLKFGFLDSLNLYTRLLAEKIDGGVTDVPKDTIPEGKLYYGSNRIYTQRGVKKMFILNNLPSTLERGFVSDIRAVVQRAVSKYNTTHGLNEHVHVNLVLDAEHYKLDLGDRNTQGRWKYFAREHERIAAKLGNRRLEDELQSDKYSDGVRRKVNSFLYIKEAMENDSAFYKGKVILEFVASTNDVLQDAEHAFRGYTFRAHLDIREVFIQTNEYMRAYAPTRASGENLVRNMNPGDVFADDILSSLSVCTHGTIGDKWGVYHGIDVQSRGVFAMDLTKGKGARTIFVTAASGEGKSKYIKMVKTFYNMLPQYGTVTYDYEGEEYTPLGRIQGSVFVGLGVGNGLYANTMVIGRLTGNPKIDAGLKTEAVGATVRIFNLLVDEEEGMTRQELALFSDCLNAVYNDFGVSDDPKTWKLSEQCTFYHIYAKLVQLKDHPETVKEYGLNAILDFIIALKPYFEKGGVYSHWFKNPISVQEIIDSKDVVFKFGMGGQDEAMIDQKYLALRQLFASYLTMLVAAKNRAEGLFTVVVYEELNRYLKQRYSGENVAAVVSGGRKLGIITYLVTNAPSEFMMYAKVDPDDPNPVARNVANIMGNVTVPIIGALYRTDMDALIRYFNLENARGVLYQLSDIKENERVDDPLKYGFFVRYRGQCAVVRMLSHPALEELPIYETLAGMQDGKDSEKQAKLRMNVGEEAIKRSISLALEREKGRMDWSSQTKGSRIGALWQRKEKET